jgi:hypothetical protein
MDMTEAEWLRSDDPQAMLTLMRGKESSRQLRLFCVACFQIVHPLLPGKAAQDLMTWIEKSADRLVSPEGDETGRLYWAARAGLPCDHLRAGVRNAARAANSALVLMSEYAQNYPDRKGKRAESEAVCGVSRFVVEAVKGSAKGNRAAVVTGEKQRQANLVRDIFFTPFRTAAVPPAWLTCDVVSLAQAIYSDGAFDRIPILGDALEDAGCDKIEVLEHCRQSGEHVKGCWLVDLLLRNE